MEHSSSELDQLRATARAHTEQVADLAQRICAVPAPTGNEWQRAQFVATLLQQRGYLPDIDEIGNVYVRRGKRGQGPVLMILAHTDTVFPLATPLHIRREGNILRGPSIGDNSASVATMITLLEVLDKLHIETAVDIVAVADVGEEGLGNLCGARAAVRRYYDDLGAVIALDGELGRIVPVSVGSKRWRVTVRGTGGHSFAAFGRPNAIYGLARIITAIAELEVPKEPCTTYNVGIIEGGTSVNTIAAEASALIDLRSINEVMLNRLAEQVRAIIEQRAGEGLHTEITVLGERPAGQRSLSDPLVRAAAHALEWLGIEVRYGRGSTDANIPMSMNIPSICVGLTYIAGAHTTDEYLYVPPLGNGLAQLLFLCIEASTLIDKGTIRASK
ncbi:MAG: M20/M25/M40 family metallo-hydrolase [Chloroflexi bacterium]|nr:MAG: M20/M25/M40 family metallo-hydrolase [Chloroflexota bacterium]